MDIDPGVVDGGAGNGGGGVQTPSTPPVSAPATPPSDPGAQAKTTPEGSPPSSPSTQSTTDSPPAAPVSTGPDWDSSDNPYKLAAQQHAQKVYQYEQQQLQTAATQYAQTLVSQGATPQQAEATAQAALQQAMMQKQLVGEREALAEQAKPIVAQRLAEEIERTHGVKISAKELLFNSSGQAIASPQEMLARADALVGERKQAVFNQRQKAGADLQPGGAPSTPAPAFDKNLTPEQNIKQGLAAMRNK